MSRPQHADYTNYDVVIKITQTPDGGTQNIPLRSSPHWQRLMGLDI